MRRGTLAEPPRQTPERGARRVWGPENLIEIADRWGTLQVPKSAVISTYAPKGGCYKTSLSLNIARYAALNGARVVVVGLDPQADLTAAFAVQQPAENLEALRAIEQQTVGLLDVCRGRPIHEALLDTDIPGLSLVPEKADLARLEHELSGRISREAWLSNAVIRPLFESDRAPNLIIFDCPPTWSALVAASIYAADLVVHPLEVSSMAFRGIDYWLSSVRDFELDLGRKMEVKYIPTRYHPRRALASEILGSYRADSPGPGLCSPLSVIRDSSDGEEASAAGLSIPEYRPRSPAAAEMREAVTEIFTKIAEIEARS